MEKLSKSDLLRVIDEQKDKLSRYESRLRDVVAAYKGLLKEKEALESSLKALTVSSVAVEKSAQQSSSEKSKTKPSDEDPAASSVSYADDEVNNVPNKENGEDNSCRDTEESGTESGADLVAENENPELESAAVEQLRLQLTTLTHSLSTLSAEKSRMEAGFQADKRLLRQERDEREKIIHELRSEIQLKEKQHRSELEALKSKLIVERHEREREQSDHGAMFRELQKVATDDRQSKGQLESTVKELKARVAHSEQLEKRLRDAQNELESLRGKLRKSEATAQETSPILLQLQAEMSLLKQQHTIAIQEEQKRARDAEERAHHLAAVHEERVANLESRLAELSDSVGNYDRLRQSDQTAIQRLKEHIAQLDATIPPSLDHPEKDEATVEVDTAANVQIMLDQLFQLKNKILELNGLSEKPIDVEGAIIAQLSDFSYHQAELHITCREEIERLRQELLQAKNTQKQPFTYHPRNREGTEPDALKVQVRSLQERVRMLNSQLEQAESAEQEWKSQAQRNQQQLEAEKLAWREKVSALESELRSRAVQTEQQLALQRERSLALLEDKEQEIRTLKSSFQMFLPVNVGDHSSRKVSRASESELTDQESIPVNSESTTSKDRLPGILLETLGSITSAPNATDTPHILHYAHELARREVDISALRKIRNRLENSIRAITKTLAAERELHTEERDQLKEKVARLERCQSREGANLEYLKNVVLSFLESSSPSSKRHMLNAIAAVLRFSDEEMERISRHSSNSWWYNTAQ